MKSVSIANDKTSDLRRTVALILIVLTVISVMTLAVMPASNAADTSGTTGDATWTLTQNEDTDTYTLTISGKGKMADYHYTDPGYEDDLPPWQGHSSKITNIVLSDGLTRIGSYAFYGTAITGIDIPDTVRYIGASAFWFCTSLESVTIPSSVWDIETGAFGACRALTDLSFADSAKVRSIGASAFEATAIKSLDLSGLASLIEIWDGAFQSSSLESVTFPAKLETVCPNAFNSCFSLSTVTVPEGSMLVSLGEKAFNDTALVSVDLSNATRLSSIGESAFGSCESLTSVTLAENFGGDATGAFTGSTSLTSVSVGSSSVTIDGNDGFTIPVASIGDIGYSSLLEAVNAATEGQTITITKGDVYEAGKVVVEGKSITIDLNGKTFTSIETITVSKDATLTIKDSGGNGNLIGESNPLIQVNGTFNLESGLLTGENSRTMVISGTFNMSGGTVSCEKNYAVYASGGIINIKAGTVGPSSSYSVYAAKSTTLTIGETDTAGPTIMNLYPNNANVYMYSGSIEKVSSSFGSESTFNCTFGSDVSQYLPSGYMCIESEDGFKVVTLTEDKAVAKIGDVLYASLVKAASEMTDGQTLTLLADYIGASPVKVNIFYGTIDLNGFDITCTKTGTSGYGINVAKGSEYDVSQSNTIVITSDSPATVKASYPVTISSGDSRNSVFIQVEGAVTLESTENRDLIKLGTGASAIFTENIRECFVNGGFVSTTSGVQYVYGTAALALSRSDDGSAEMLNDFVGSITIGTAGNYTLDLGGNTVTYNGNPNTDSLDAAITIYGNITITIKNGSIVSGGSGIAPGLVHSGGTENNVSLTLDDVDLKADLMYAIYSNGTCENIEVKVVNGSSVECTSKTGVGIYFPADGSLTITDSTVKGATGVEVRKGSLEISGDSTRIEATAETFTVNPTPDGGGSTVVGAAVAISPYDGLKTMKVEIAGGTFTGAVAFAQAHADDASTMPTFDFSISGGTFTSTGIDPVTQQTYPAIVTEDGEVTERFVTGGTFMSGTTADDSANQYVDSAYTVGDDGSIVPDLENAVARIGDDYYTDLREALSASKEGDTVYLLQSVTADGWNIGVTKGITLDLGGNTITISDTGTSNVGIYFQAGESTLKNGRIVDERQAAEAKSMFAIYVFNSGTSVTITDVDVEITNSVAKNSTSVAAFVYGYASLTLGSGFTVTAVGDTAEGAGNSTGAMIQGYNGTGTGETKLTILEGADIHVHGFGVSGNGSSGYTDTVIDIQGGTITSDSGAGIYHPQIGKMDVKGGTITGTTGIEVRSGTVNVTGGTITGNGNPFESDPNSNGSTTVGAGIAIVQHTTKNAIDVNISGGDISGYRAVYEANLQKNEQTDIEKIDISITGGNFEAINGGTEAVQVDDNEIIGDVVTGGTFNTDVSEYMPDGMETETDPETGEVTVLSPVRFDTSMAMPLTSIYLLMPTLSPGATITGYQVVSGTGVTVTDKGVVTFTENQDTNAVIRVTATMNGAEYTADISLSYYGTVNITTDSGVEIVAEAIDSTTEMDDMLAEVDLPDGATLDPDGWLFFDVYRTDDSTQGVTFRLNMPAEQIGDMSAFVVHFGDTAEPVDFTMGEGYIEIHATSFSPFGVCMYTPAIEPEPEPEPDIPVIIPDDDDYVPLPPTVVIQDDGDGDMTGVAACAAAAVAAAIIAAFLIMEYRKN